jgi:hypothetical protein
VRRLVTKRERVHSLQQIFRRERRQFRGAAGSGFHNISTDASQAECEVALEPTKTGFRGLGSRHRPQG